MTWNVVHNFPGAKDTYEVPVDYPNVGYDTIIASWFTDIFTSILAIEEALIGVTRIVLLRAGDTMLGDLIIGESAELTKKLKIAGFESWETTDLWRDAGIVRLDIPTESAFSIVDKTEGTLVGFSFEGIDFYKESIFYANASLDTGITIDGINLKLPVWAVDIEVSNKTKGLILKSPNDSRFRLEVSDGGVLSTEAL